MTAEASKVADDLKLQLQIKTQLSNGGSGYLSDNESGGKGGRSSRSRSTRGRSQPFFIGVAGTARTLTLVLMIATNGTRVLSFDKRRTETGNFAP